MTFLPGWFHGGAGAVNLEFSAGITDFATAKNDASVNTFSDMDLGDEPSGADKRYIAVAVGAFQSANRTINSVTIAGITAAEIVAANSEAPCGIYVAEVPTGITGDVVVTCSADVIGVGVTVCRLLNPADPMGFDTASGVHSSGTIDLSLNIPEGGAALALAQSINASSTTWSGLTELVDTDVDSADFYTAAFGGSEGSPHAVTADNADNTPVRFQGHAVAWGPI